MTSLLPWLTVARVVGADAQGGASFEVIRVPGCASTNATGQNTTVRRCGLGFPYRSAAEVGVWAGEIGAGRVERARYRFGGKEISEVIVDRLELASLERLRRDVVACAGTTRAAVEPLGSGLVVVTSVEGRSAISQMRTLARRAGVRAGG